MTEKPITIHKANIARLAKKNECDEIIQVEKEKAFLLLFSGNLRKFF